MASASSSIPEAMIPLPSPTSTHSHSPGAASVDSGWTRADMLKQEGDDRRSFVGPQRSSSCGRTGLEVEKKKRSRVTPEQLVHLENFFAQERSPTARRRKEISDMLGMHDRQTQIWFQNRRAKEKQLNEKRRARSSGGTPPSYPYDLPGSDLDVARFIHEDEPITVIPCADLTIGSWRRIAISRQDLIAYICHSRRFLAWYIHSTGHGFKMEIPFDIIMEANLTSPSPGQAIATFILSGSPIFYMEGVAPSPVDGAPPLRQWKQCSDWTEDHQASTIARHELVGPSVQLSQIVSDIRARALRPHLSPDGSMTSNVYPNPPPLTVLLPPPFSGSSSGPSSYGTPVDTEPSQPGAGYQTHSYPPPPDTPPPQRHGAPHLTLRLHNSSYNTSSLYATLPGRQHLAPQILSAPPTAQSFFPSSSASTSDTDLLYQPAFETYRRHSSVIIPSYHVSPSPPPPAIAYARRASEDPALRPSTSHHPSTYSSPLNDTHSYAASAGTPPLAMDEFSNEGDNPHEYYADSPPTLSAAYYPSAAFVNSAEDYSDDHDHPHHLISNTQTYYSYTDVDVKPVVDML